MIKFTNSAGTLSIACIFAFAIVTGFVLGMMQERTWTRFEINALYKELDKTSCEDVTYPEMLEMGKKRKAKNLREQHTW